MSWCGRGLSGNFGNSKWVFVWEVSKKDARGWPANDDPLRCLDLNLCILPPLDLFEYLVPDMSPDVHCNWCNHCYILGMPGTRPDIRCVQYLSEVHKKVPNEFEHQVEPLKSGTDIRDLSHHWMSNRYPQTSCRCQK